MDLRELLESWMLALKASRRADNTLKSYRAGVEAYLAWCGREDLPAVLDRNQVRAWIGALMDAGAEPATTAARQAAIKRFSRWLFEEDEQDVDPLLGLKPPQQPEKLVQPLTEDELRALLKACSGKTFMDRRDEAIVRVMMDSGLRPGEVAELRVEDVDLREGIVTVWKSKNKKGKTPHIGPKTCAAVDRWLRTRRTHKLADGPQLWLGTRGREFHYAALWLALRGRAADAGITRRFHPHLFRHTKATRWLASGGSEGGLQASMGWSSRKQMDRYTAATASQRAVEEAARLNLGDL
jgi:site-specific recombinase XerD